MDFNPCMKHRLVRGTVREFAEAEIAPLVYDLDREARFPWEVVEKMRPLNFFGLQIPRAYGGAGLDAVSYAVVIEELSRVSAALGLCVTVHNSVGAYPIVMFGTEAQKRRFLPALAGGERIGAFCLTEANAGSDAGGVETHAQRENGGYVINGTKIFVTNGGVCGTALIFAVTHPEDPRRRADVFIVEKGTPGFSVGEIEDLCGMRANPVSSLFFEDCSVPEMNRLGRSGDGIKIGLSALDTGRIGIAAQALGIAQAAFDASVRYAKERQQFGKPIAAFQTIQNYLADMATEIDAGRLLLYRACAQKDAGRPFGPEAAKAKLFCSRLAMRTADRAVQIHGGYGYSKEYDVERYFRDAKVTEIYEGTSEVQRMVISRSVLSQPV
ncbi:acyl-CoA dehydrogenase [Desulfococcus multivorans]|jgi:butyryl-CoA dehydrogenase|uniref:Acyl-CoA dehydrogenase domain-containing protein n=2 Tax=Desulfococcaceae TaxID=2931039 RepID=S7UPI5_DESML|nr:acyl-CoA dehydrogenase family protein [Desulfococcus multivorans]AQV02079.1 acyl-CoA dehydrogenase [Desulfococcus multivorans]EPR35924.1 acyl-CoA dehydrogenase domain-containing protein [Desulfococcus multivorans DSM 2059]SJZ35209.1 butyryl-CoA dehydrogenase [Desulfococcus multivorans DSM 2059]